MSITPCFLVFILCLPLHACNARPLGTVYIKNTLEKKFHHFPKIKSDMKNDFEEKSVAVVLEAKSHADDDDDDDDDDVNHKSVPSVSWGVHHGKRGEEHPDFTLDYSTPKTHPPSHN